MLNVIDQTSDLNGQQLYRLSKLYPLPEFVKKASSTDIYGTEELESHQFADPSTRQFPCHTASATYISTLFFLDKKANISNAKSTFIDSRLDDFAFLHGISERITNLKEKLANTTVTDDLDVLSDNDFAVTLSAEESSTGRPERRYPLRNALEVKQAAEYLHEYRYAFPYSMRQKFASKVLDKANEYGASLGDLDVFIEKQAGRGMASSNTVVELLSNRSRLLKRANQKELSEKMGELAKTISNDPATIHDEARLIKLASIVDEVDTVSGMKRYIEDLQAPEDAFFNINIKSAQALKNDHLSTTSGNIYNLADMDELKLQDVKNTMGDEFADAVSTGGLFVSTEKLAEIAPTLPRGDAELFDNLLSSVGINPVCKEAAHEPYGFSSAELKVLAQVR